MPDAPAASDPAADARAALSAALFAPGARAYAIADGAARPDLLGLLHDAGVPPAPLVAGRLDPAALALAPHLVPLAGPEDPAFAALLQGWGRDAAVWLRSSLAPPALTTRLRDSLAAQTPEGPALFRLCDPRVARTALPRLSAANRAALLAGIDLLLCEDEGGAGLLRLAP